MQTIERSAFVPFTPAQMYALVNDIEKYPEFLPWCVGSSVQDLSATERVATLKIARGALNTSFSTRNTLVPGHEILMRLDQGPFKRLTGRWSFVPIADAGARVTLHVAFEFKNTLTALALSSTFESVCSAMVDAFASRARKIYG